MKTIMAISLALAISLILYAASFLINPSHYKIFVVAFVFGLSCAFLLRYKK